MQFSAMTKNISFDEPLIVYIDDVKYSSHCIHIDVDYILRCVNAQFCLVSRMEVIRRAHKGNPIPFCRGVLTSSLRNELPRKKKQRKSALVMASGVFYASIRAAIPILSILRETSRKV